MSKRDPQLLIDDMINSIDKIKIYIGQSEYSEFIIKFFHFNQSCHKP